MPGRHCITVTGPVLLKESGSESEESEESRGLAIAHVSSIESPRSHTLACYSLLSTETMSQKPLQFRVPSIVFRVLIVGRANAGKTTILQRVCETTESPKIFRVSGGRREEVGACYSVLASAIVLSFCQVHLDPNTEVNHYPCLWREFSD